MFDNATNFYFFIIYVILVNLQKQKHNYKKHIEINT